MPDDPTRDLDDLLRAVNEAAAAVGTRLVTLATVGGYIALTVASTTDEMLLRTTNLVSLPLIDTEIPIGGWFGFYTLAPLLVLLLHWDLLLRLALLHDGLTRLDAAMVAAPERREAIMQRLTNSSIVSYLSGRAPSRVAYLISALFTWVVVVVVPLALLLWIQVRFVPAHDWKTNLVHQLVVVADVVLVFISLLPRIRVHQRSAMRQRVWGTGMTALASVQSLVVLTTIVGLGFSFLLATVPPDGPRTVQWFPQDLDLSDLVLASVQPKDVNTLRDSTDVTRLNQVLDGLLPYRNLKGRDLRNANLNGATLPKLDLRAVRVRTQGEVQPPPAECAKRRGCDDPPQCVDPHIRRTSLRGANLRWASMQRAMLDDAILEEADLGAARLQWTVLSRARLNGATLVEARMGDARLDSAKLCGANLQRADLRNTDLRLAHLQGANLEGAVLRGANLEGADLQGADLSRADLTGAHLRGARLRCAVLAGAKRARSDPPLARSEPRTPEQSADCLVLLACSNSHVARSLAHRVLNHPGPAAEALGSALLRARASGECTGAAALPDRLKEKLEVFVRDGATGPEYATPLPDSPGPMG